MAISSQPTVLAQSNDAYINVGVTGRLQTFSAATGTLTINPTSGSFIRITNLVGAVTVNWTGVPAGYGTRWQVEVRNRGANAVAFNGVTWDGGSTPTIASGTAASVLNFYSPDGGVTIFGRLEFATVA
jgi:type II secretory pathway component GspD/PulD (secretin)